MQWEYLLVGLSHVQGDLLGNQGNSFPVAEEYEAVPL